MYALSSTLVLNTRNVCSWTTAWILISVFLTWGCALYFECWASPNRLGVSSNLLALALIWLPTDCYKQRHEETQVYSSHVRLFFEWSMDELSLLNTAVLGLAMHGPAAAPVFHGFLVWPWLAQRSLADCLLQQSQNMSLKDGVFSQICYKSVSKACKVSRSRSAASYACMYLQRRWEHWVMSTVLEQCFGCILSGNLSGSGPVLEARSSFGCMTVLRVLPGFSKTVTV